MKKRIVLIFGGKSAEHEVSIASAASIFKNIDKEKYIIGTIGVNKEGFFIENTDPTALKPLQESVEETSIKLDNKPYIFLRDNWLDLINDADIIFPLIHGPSGEDGSLQGMLETLNKKYVGSKVTSSAICMDKSLAKIILKSAGLPVVPYKILNKKEYDFNQKLDLPNQLLNFPLFIKPANLGSSIGITKVKFETELSEALELAFSYDNKVLIEKAMQGRELEISVLGNDELKVSLPGEIVTLTEYYDYDTKYVTDNAELIVPAKVSDNIIEEIKDYAKRAYRVLGCKGLARIDFFLENNKLYINEVNTIPGFTKISMYPRLFIHEGITYTKLITTLIELAENEE
ncbi:MAG: D-alanine--D-alanine ligase family protein [Clostridia bacterium]